MNFVLAGDPLKGRERASPGACGLLGVLKMFGKGGRARSRHGKSLPPAPGFRRASNSHMGLEEGRYKRCAPDCYNCPQKLHAL
jgi:hypothetical protein